MARYEFEDGKSHKFWEIEVDGATFTVRYGKVGTAGQTNTKVFDSAEEAKKEAEKVTRSKVKKGYVEVAVVAKVEPGRELEQAILDDPEDEAAWRVYADWLMAEGDPRGEFVMAQIDGRDTAALMEANEKAWLGRFAKDLATVVSIEWRHGFWDSARIAYGWDVDVPDDVSSEASAIGHLLRHPSAQFLRSLRLGMPADYEEPSWQEAIDAVVKNGIRPSLRHLFVGDFEYPDETEMSWTEVGSLEKLWAVVPRLEHLEVQGGGFTLGAIQAPHLRHLQLRTGGLQTEPAERLAAATFPVLERLEVWWGTEDYAGECTPEHALAVLEAALKWPALRWLGFMNSDFANALPALIVKSDVLPRLSGLDLSMGTMTDEGARVILENASKFAHLETLNLVENFIGDEVTRAIQTALPKANLAEQEEGDDDYLYVSVGE